MSTNQLVQDLCRRLPALKQALLSLLLVLPAVAGSTDVPRGSEDHLRSARQHAQASAQLLVRMKQWCGGEPPSARSIGNLQQALLEAEAKFRADREAQRMHPVATLIERECLAHRLAALDSAFQSPVWYLSQVRFIRVTHGRGPHGDLEAVAQAHNAKGPIVNNRITFSMGLHHSCFGYTDANGVVACTLVDTHPHGSEDEHKDEAETVVASLQGSMSDALVEWPTTSTRKLAKRSGHAVHPMRQR